MSRAYQQWVRAYQDQAWTLARYLLKDASEAEDAVALLDPGGEHDDGNVVHRRGLPQLSTDRETVEVREVEIEQNELGRLAEDFEAMVGALAASGSVIAWGKLAEKIPGRPIRMPAQQVWTIGLAVAGVAAAGRNHDRLLNAISDLEKFL